MVKARPFASLHHHATNSYGDGFRTPEEHVEAVAELGYTAMALTDHGNVSGHVKLEKAANKAGIKPIFGCELYCEIKSDERGQLKNHLTVLAETQEGYRNLNRLVTASWQNFRYKPTVTSSMLADHSEGLIVMSGCMGGLLATAMLGGKGTPDKARPDIDAGRRVAEWFADVFPDRYYLEVMPHPELERQTAYNQSLRELGNRLDLPLVATLDCHYPKTTDQDMYPVLHAIDRGGSNNTAEAQSQSWEYGIMLAPLEVGAIHKKLQRAGLPTYAATHAMDSTAEIADRCQVEIPKFKELRFPTKPGVSSAKLFRDWCVEGWNRRGFHHLSFKERERYGERVRYEMNLIEDKGFIDYFLVIAEMVVWAKENGIAVGPARGSAAASLVCYLLRITEVNPMLFHSLLFERFVDPNRHDLPDVDLDFDDERRHEVRQHLVDQYGAERVGSIGTFTQYRGKNSIDDIARVHRLPKADVDAVKEMIVDRSVGDLRGHLSSVADTVALFPRVREIFKRHPKLHQAIRLEGNLKGFSIHAAGLVVADQPLTDGVATYTRTDAKGDVRSVISIDKYDAEYVGALKIDALGLLTMNVISRCVDMAGMTLQELYDVKLDSEPVYEAFRRGEVVGIFQFDGRAMRSINREVKPDNFAEICDINAISRPGPLHSGAAAHYIEVKHGRKPAEHFHPVVDEITKWTNYQIVYQEQILQVVRRMAGFTWEQAAKIRRLISKKEGEAAFNQMQDLFMTGCKKNGLKEVSAAKVWKQIVTSGAYAFNSAHCVSYGMLAYYTMWLKVNFPLEFYCAGLQKYDPKTKGFDLLKEASAKGIEILPPDPHYSQVNWTIDKKNNRLIAGFVQITGIGEKTAKQMVEWREGVTRVGTEPFVSWQDFSNVKGIGPKTMERVEEFCGNPDPFGIELLANQMKKVRGWLNRNAEPYGMRRPTGRSEDVPYEPKKGMHTLLVAVRDRNVKDLFESHRSRTGQELDTSNVREPQHANWVVLMCEDETGPIIVTVHRFRGLYEKYREKIWEMDIKKQLLLVRGHKRDEYRRAIYAEEIWFLDPETLKG